MSIDDLDQYKIALKKVEEEKKKYSGDGFIHSGKVPHENFSCNLIPECIREEHTMLFMTLILNLDEVNELLFESYDIWNKIHNHSKEVEVVNSYSYNKLRINSVIIIHIIKHYIDMMLVFILKYIFNLERKIDCIGRWKNYTKKPRELSKLDDFQDFFDLINDMENANKHHLKSIYTAQLIGQDELCFFAIKENKDNKDNKLYAVRAIDIIKRFNELYKVFNDIIEENYKVEKKS